MENTLIERKLYLKQIKDFIDKPFIKVVVGIRRSGKSELLNLVKQHLIHNGIDANHIIFINFEDLEFQSIKNYEDLTKFVLSKMSDKKKYYLFFDEPQEVYGWEKAINGLRLKNVDIYVTVSNSKLLDTDFSTLLGGRYVMFTIYPLSYMEFIKFRMASNMPFEIDEYIKFGGFPSVSIYNYDEKNARHIVTDIHNSALFQDVIKKNNVKNPQLMDKIIGFIYDNVGSLISIKSINNYLKSNGRKGTDVETISNYIKYLEQGFILQRASRYDIKGKKLLETNDKYYLTDHSLQYVVRDFRQDHISGILENIVYMELIRREYKVYVGKIDSREIDFVAEQINGNKIYVQVCLEFSIKETYNREFDPLKEIKDNYPKYVVSMDKYAKRNDSGVIGISLKDFLLLEKL